LSRIQRAAASIASQRFAARSISFFAVYVVWRARALAIPNPAIFSTFGVPSFENRVLRIARAELSRIRLKNKLKSRIAIARRVKRNSPSFRAATHAPSTVFLHCRATPIARSLVFNREKRGAITPFRETDVDHERVTRFVVDRSNANPLHPVGRGCARQAWKVAGFALTVLTMLAGAPGAC
jgi:hypothetical protein